MNKEKRRKIFSLLAQNNPKPETELQYENSYQLLVSVILSAQATDKSVNLATKSLFEIVKSPHDMIIVGEEKLRQYIRTIGLYKKKAENVIAMSQQLIDNYDGKIPEDYDKLVALPGVGRKTALVILNTVFGKPVIAVDTHVFRVSNRTKIATGKIPIEVDRKLHKFVPDKYKRNAHHLLILHGRYTCRAQKPLCAECLIETLCEYNAKNT